MTASGLAVVAVAGAFGAVLRHELTTDRPLAALHVVNVVGATLLGLVLGLGITGASVGATLATAGLGAMTSFSTWIVGARSVATAPGVERPWVRLAGHVLVPATVAVAAAWLAHAIGRALAPVAGAGG